MNKRIFLLILLSFLVSCDGEYGEDTEKFVNRKVPGLSLKIAETGLEKKIYQGYILEFSKLMLEAQTIFETIQKIEPKLDFDFAGLTMRDAQLKREKLIKNESKILQLKSYLISLREEQKELRNICESIDPGTLRDVVKNDIFEMTVPEKVEEYYVGTDMIEMFVKNVINIFNSNSQAKQNSIMAKAIQSIPSKIPSADHLKELYREKCLIAQEDFHASAEIKEFEKTYNEIMNVISQNVSVHQKLINVLSSHIYQMAYKDLVKKYGIDEIENSETRIDMISRILSLYGQLSQRDYQIMKEFNARETKDGKLNAKSEWDQVFRDRMLLLEAVKEDWPFYQEKVAESLERKRFVELYVSHTLKDQI